MPPVPPTKFARTSIEGWSRKRSVSPGADASSSKKGAAATHASNDCFTPRRSDDGLFYEDEYREEHIKYLLAMEVCVIWDSHLGSILLTHRPPIWVSQNSWTSSPSFSGGCART